MTTTVTITGENGLDCATQLRNFFIGLQMANPVATEEQAKAGVVAKKTAKPPVDDEEEAPKPKAKAKPAAKKPVDEDDEEEAPKPKAKAKAKAPVDEEEEDEEPAPKPKAKAKAAETKAAVGELVDDGEEQPATVDGCRVMIRRVARAAGCGADFAQAVLAEFGVAGATKVPPKKFQAFIDRCQEVIDDPECIEVEEAE